MAEEFALVGLEPDGREARDGMILPAASACVTLLLIAELVDGGHLRLGADLEIDLDAFGPAHPLLDREHRCLRPFQGERLATRLRYTRHVEWSQVLDSLVDAGVLARRRRLLRRTLHPVIDRGAHADLRSELRRASTVDEPMTDRVARLLTFAHAARLPVIPYRGPDVIPPRVEEAWRRDPLAAELADLVPSLSDGMIKGTRGT